MASTIKVDKIEGSTGSTITVPTGQTLTVTDGIPVASGGTGLASFTAGDILYATGSTTLAKLGKGTAEQVLAMNTGATAPDWGSVDLTVLPTITVAKGGTNLTSFTAGDVLYATGSTTLAKLAKGSAADVLTMNSGATAPEWSAPAGGGLTEADSWRVNTSFTGDANPIASNWERSDSAGQGKVGTGMTESSGVFTFPSTGWWLITFGNVCYTGGGADLIINIAIKTTTDDSTYITAGTRGHSMPAGPSRGSSVTDVLFDVDNVSNCKVQFNFNDENASTTCNGDSDTDYTAVKFLRLADT